MLVSKPLSSLADYTGHPNLGQLVQPRSWWTPDGSVPWAADNDAFNSFDAGRFRQMLERLEGVPNCLWVAAPDVVADAAATLRQFDEWQPEIRAAGFPVALVLQDGMTVDSVPWSRVDAVFVGGSTEYKLGVDAQSIVAEAARRRLATHMGRVNTRRRMKVAKAWRCGSVDGTASAMFTDLIVPWMLSYAGAPTQLTFGGS